MLQVKWCYNRIKTPHENIMPEFRMLAFKSMQGGALFESFLLSPFPILKKYSNNKYFKHSTKSCLKYF